MLYIRKFDNDTDRERYLKTNFVSPHIFYDKSNKNFNYFPKFKRLSYISSTATGGQYIDLGCQLMNSTDDIKIDIKFNIRGVGKSSSGSDPNLATLIGSQSESGSPWPGFILRRCSANGNYIMLQTKWEFSNSTKAPNSNKWYSNYLSVSTGGSDWENLHSWGNIYEFSETLDNIPQLQVNDCACSLFCAFDGNGNPFRYALADLYYLKFTKGNTVIRNLIPVQRMKDNEVGLWDLENQVFYTSQGEESFVAGPELKSNLGEYQTIEYLESTGTQYIDIEYIPTGDDIKIEGKYQPKNYTGAWGAWFGSYVDENTEAYRIIRNQTDNTAICFNCGTNASNSYGYNGIVLNTIYTYELTKNQLILNSNIITHSNNTVTKQNINSLYLFSNSYRSTPSIGRHYYFKVYKNNILVRDLIPVRKGDIGYMYDKISKKVFGNKGTGYFILGPDTKYKK